MNTDQLLNQIDDIIESGSKTMRGRVAVDAEAIRAAIDEIRVGLPDEISQAKLIVADRNNILAKAKKEAVNVVNEAQEKSRALVSAAEDKVRTLVVKTEDYCKNKVAEAEAQAGKTISDANEEAESIKAEARAQADKLIDSSAIVIEAKAKADKLSADALAAAKQAIDNANIQTATMVATANDQFEFKTKQAEEQSAEIIAKANNWASEIRSSTMEFIDSVMNTADESVARALNEIQNARNSFVNIAAQADESIADSSQGSDEILNFEYMDDLEG